MFQNLFLKFQSFKGDWNRVYLVYLVHSHMGAKQRRLPTSLWNIPQLFPQDDYNKWFMIEDPRFRFPLARGQKSQDGRGSRHQVNTALIEATVIFPGPLE